MPRKLSQLQSEFQDTPISDLLLFFQKALNKVFGVYVCNVSRSVLTSLKVDHAALLNSDCSGRVHGVIVTMKGNQKPFPSPALSDELHL